MPTGHQILDLFDRGPADEHVLLMLPRSSGLDVIDLAETIDIRGRGAERFFAFRTDRTWNWAIDGRRFPWGARHIPEPLVRLIARIPEDHALYLAKTDMPDEEVEAGTAIDLDAPGLERLRSEEHTSELQSLMRISYAVFCLKKNSLNTPDTHITN